MPVLYSFNTILEGHHVLKILIKDNFLCEKLCYIQSKRLACTGHGEGSCSGACVGKESAPAYNVRVKYAIKQLKTMLPSFAILDAGRTEDEQSCILVEQGKLYGMGYISQYSDVKEPGTLKSALQPFPSNDYIMHLILAHTELYPQKRISI